MRLAKEVTEVLSSHGNNQLGGDDFDGKILEHLVAHLKEQGTDPSMNRVAMARLTRAAETAKIALSDAPFVRIDEEYLLEHQGKPVNLSLELSRDDYEAMIAPYIDETMDAVHTALEGAGLGIGDLSEVLLVGGATCTPLIQQRLEELLRMQPRNEVDPDLCVASGAAIQAAVIGGQRVSRVLVDVTPYTFGTSALGELNGDVYPFVYVPLIRKNTPIPVTKSEAFSTIEDGQPAIDVRVYQGEDPDALNNTEIGAFRIEGLSDAPAGNVIVTTFSLDVNGILKVTSREKRTGLESASSSTTPPPASSRTPWPPHAHASAHSIDGDFNTEPSDGSATLGESVAASAERRDSVQATALIEKAERLMETANAEDREDLVNLIETLRDAVAAHDDVAIHEAMEGLSDLIFYLES
ncbi:Heat shock protein 70 (fragment) [Thiocapsa sp. KS1]